MDSPRGPSRFSGDESDDLEMSFISEEYWEI